MIIPPFIPFVNRIAMKQLNFNSRKKVWNVITWREYCQRCKIDNFLHCFQTFFIWQKRIGAACFNKPDNHTPSFSDLLLQRAQNGISIG